MHSVPAVCPESFLRLVSLAQELLKQFSSSRSQETPNTSRFHCNFPEGHTGNRTEQKWQKIKFEIGSLSFSVLLSPHLETLALSVVMPRPVPKVGPNLSKLPDILTFSNFDSARLSFEGTYSICDLQNMIVILWSATSHFFGGQSFNLVEKSWENSVQAVHLFGCIGTWAAAFALTRPHIGRIWGSFGDQNSLQSVPNCHTSKLRPAEVFDRGLWDNARRSAADPGFLQGQYFMPCLDRLAK